MAYSMDMVLHACKNETKAVGTLRKSQRLFVRDVYVYGKKD